MKVDFVQGGQDGSEQQLQSGHEAEVALQTMGSASQPNDGAHTQAALANGGQPPGGFMGQPAGKAPAQTSNPHPEYQLPSADKVIHVHLSSGDTTFKLPANASFDTIRIVGKDLVLVQRDGTAIVLDDAADKVPNVTVGDVEVPKEALAAAFTDNGIQAAEGPSGSSTPGSSGGNFNEDAHDIGHSFPLSPLQPPESFGFSAATTNPVIPLAVFQQGSVGGDSSVSVNESGLPGGSAPLAGADSSATHVSFTAGTDNLALTLAPASNTTRLPGGETIVWSNLDGQHVVGKENGETVIELSIASTTIAARATGTVTVTETLLAPITGEGSASGNLGVVNVVATDGGAHQTFTDNVTVTVVDDSPKANPDRATAPDGGTLTVDAAHGLFSASNTGGAEISGADSPAYLTSVSAGGTTQTLHGSGASGKTTIVGADGALTVNGDGSFSYVANHNVAAGTVDMFQYMITDADGSTSTSTLAITVGAGTPPVGGATGSESVLESALPGGSAPNAAGLTASANVAFSAGADDLHLSLDASKLTTAISGLTWQVTPNGQEIQGWQNGVEVVKFDLSTPTLAAGASGNVTVTETLLNPISGEGTTANDLGAVTVTGTDTVNPATVSDTVVVGVIDDAPKANPDTAAALDGGLAVTGSVTANDVTGADAPITVTGVVATSNGNAAGTIGSALAGEYGTLTLNANGTFSYTPDNNVAAKSQDVFTYTITDADGSTSTATLTVTIGAGTPPVGGATDSESVLESALAGGSAPNAAGLTASANVAFTPGADDLHLSLDASKLTTAISGLTWQVTPNGQEIQGWQNGVEVVKFDLSTPTLAAGASGAVTVTETLLNPISGEGTTANDLGAVTVTGTDTVNPATVSDAVAVGVIDDKPVANADTATAPDGGTLTVAAADGLFSASNTGGADKSGADSPAYVKSVSFGGTTHTLTGSGASATATIKGADGTLTVNGDGSFSFVANHNVAVGTVDTFGYTITDADGSTSTSTLAITIGAGAAPIGGATASEYVLESALPWGSAPNPFGLVASANVAFTAGADDLHLTLGTSGLTTAIPGLTWKVANGGQEIQGWQNGHEVVQFDLWTPTIAAGKTGPATVTELLLAPISGDGTTTDDLGSVTVIGTDKVNSATVTDTIAVGVVDDSPVANPDRATAPDGGTLFVNAAHDLFSLFNTGGADRSGADAPAYVTSVSAGATTQTLTGSGASATTAIKGADGTLTLNGDGSFSYAANHNVAVGTVDTFSYTITDSDGSTSTATLAIKIGAGAAPVGGATASEHVLESALPGGSAPNAAGLTTSANVAFTAGADDLHLSLNASKLATIPGLTWTVSADGQEIVGTQSGHAVVQFDLSSATLAAGASGNVTVTETLLLPITGEGKTAGDLGAVTVVGTDAVNPATVTDKVTVGVVDDAPVANPDAAAATDGGQAVTGSVTANDVTGADAPITVTGIVATSNGNAAGTIGSALAGEYGTLTLNANGTFTYTPDNNVAAGSKDVFTYTITDADGSTAQSTLTVTVGLGAAPTALYGGTASETVSESGLAAGTAPVSGGHPSDTATVAFHAGADDATVTLQSVTVATITPTSSYSGLSAHVVSGSEIDVYQTQNGKSVEVATFTLSGQPLISAGGTDAVTVTETLLAPVLGEGSAPGNLGVVNVVATDNVNTSQTATATVIANVADDHPVANAATLAATDGAATPVAASAGLFGATVGDKMGADQLPGAPFGGANVTGVTSNNTSGIGVAGAAGVDGVPYTASGQYGTLTLNQDGSYSYAANQNVKAGSIDTFTYTITDADGTTAQSTLTVTVGLGAAPTALYGGTASETVSESGLAAGTAPVSGGHPSDTATVAFHAGADDATVTLQSVTVATITPTSSYSGLSAQVNGANEIDVYQTQNGTKVEVATFTLSGQTAIAAGGTDAVTVTETLLAPVLGEGSAPGNLGVVNVVATDNVNTSQTATARVTASVVDDHPVANADTATAPDGGTLTVNAADGLFSASNTGGADKSGADSPAYVTSVSFGGTTLALTGSGASAAAAIGGADGLLIIHGDGSYSYFADPDVVVGTVNTFGYTITDADGSTATSTLAITIGAGDAPVGGAPASEYVFESALPHGSAPSSAGLTASAGVTFTAGADDLHLSLGTNGLTTAISGLTWKVVSDGQEIQGWQNGVEVVKFDLSAATTIAGMATIDAGTTASATVKETLLAPIAGEGTATNDLGTVTVTGYTINGASAADTVSVGVVDDGPKFNSADHGEIADASGVGVLTGNLSYLTGADTPVSLSFTGVSHNEASPTATSYTSNGLNVSEYVDSSGVLHGFTSSGGVYTDVFTVSLNASNSTYSFDLKHPLDSFQAATVTAGGDVVGQNSHSYALISDASGNQIAVLTGYDTTSKFDFGDWFYESNNTLNGSDLKQDSIIASSTGEGVGNDHFNPNEFMRFDFGAVGDNGTDSWSYGSASGAPANAVAVNQATFTFNMPGGSNSVVDYVVHSTDGTVSNGAISMDGYATLTISGHGPIDYIELYDDSGSPKVELTGVSEAASSGTMTLPFTFGVTDNDGTTASGAFDVTASGATMAVNYGNDSSISSLNGNYTEIQDTSGALGGGSGVSSATNVLVGGPENDIFISQFGPDTMTGGGGSDIFKLENINAHDVITDFIAGSSGTHDTVDLTALLTSLPTNVTTPQLADYVNYNSTTGVLSVNQSGSGTISTNASDFHPVATLDVGNNPTVHPTSSTVSIAYLDTNNHAHAHTI